LYGRHHDGYRGFRFLQPSGTQKAAFEAQIREIFADGVVTDEEKETLKRLQAHYRLTDVQVEAMLQRAQNKTAMKS
jgi:uncharacterized tellurite resistance protein B-like protein